MGGILVFWESWQNHVVNCDKMKLCKIFGLYVKLKNDKSKFLPMMTAKWEEKVLKRDKLEAWSSWQVPHIIFMIIYIFSHLLNCGSLSHLYCHTEDKHKLLVSDTPGFLYHPSVYDWYIQIYSPHFLYKSYTSHLLLEDKQITHPCQYYRCMTPYFARILANVASFSLNLLSIFRRSHDDSWEDALAGHVNIPSMWANLHLCLQDIIQP